jgi:RHH-type proline utilization regulon transcriptional repressor/proline dehydrogenase/delta 1-pyrroline-5-carboxylate dehydrogenase
LVGLTKQLVIGHARNMSTEIGPVIDLDAQQRLREIQEHAHDFGKVRVWRTDLPTDGFYVGPMVVDEVEPSSPIATDELFGPILCVFRARDFDHALELANDTPFALTAGLFSRSPAHIQRASTELRGGNVYINRGITGAVVGRHPFGGYGMSGLGGKAGGPDYLLRFCEPRVVTENTMRQGFAPESQ